VQSGMAQFRPRVSPTRAPRLRVRVGAIRGRHRLPVDRYLFDTPWVHVCRGLAGEVQRRVRALYAEGVRAVDFYPTGLVHVSVEAVAEMVRLGMDVRVWYYDRRRGTYYPAPSRRSA
jgi:hypothetical protein